MGDGGGRQLGRGGRHGAALVVASQQQLKPLGLPARGCNGYRLSAKAGRAAGGKAPGGNVAGRWPGEVRKAAASPSASGPCLALLVQPQNPIHITR